MTSSANAQDEALAAVPLVQEFIPHKPGNARIEAGFRLGWLVAALFHMPPESQAVLPTRLPGISRLEFTARAGLVTRQIEKLMAEIDGLPGKGSPTAQTLLSRIEPEAGVDRLREAVRTLHFCLLKEMNADDPVVGKAYGLGRSLFETANLPTAGDRQSYADVFRRFRIAEMGDWLKDLRDQFASYSAEAVRHGLEIWQDDFEKIDGSLLLAQHFESGEWQALLRQQGGVWFSLLSGEKRGKDLLDVDSWADAAKGFAGRARATAGRVLGWRWGLVLTILFVVGTGLAVYTAIQGDTKGLVAALVALGGVFGVSSRSVATGTRRLFSEVQRPLWDAEVIAAIGRAATRSPRDELGPLAKTKRVAQPAVVTTVWRGIRYRRRSADQKREETMAVTGDQTATSTTTTNNQPSQGGEQSLRGSFVAILTPIFAVVAGWVAGAVAKIIPGVTLDKNQIIAFMTAATTAAIAAGYKWLQGWQAHEQRVSEGTAAPVKAVKKST